MFLNWGTGFWNCEEIGSWGCSGILITFPCGWPLWKAASWSIVNTLKFCGLFSWAPGRAPQVQVQMHCFWTPGSWTGIILTPFWTSETPSESWAGGCCSGGVFLRSFAGGETLWNICCLFRGSFWVTEVFGRIGATGFGVPFGRKTCLFLTVSGSKIFEVQIFCGWGFFGVSFKFVDESSLLTGLPV